jgi:hypothetical protein
LSKYFHKEIFRRQSGGKLKKQQYHISFAGLEFFAALRIEELPSPDAELFALMRQKHLQGQCGGCIFN